MLAIFRLNLQRCGMEWKRFFAVVRASLCALPENQCCNSGCRFRRVLLLDELPQIYYITLFSFWVILIHLIVCVFLMYLVLVSIKKVFLYFFFHSMKLYITLWTICQLYNIQTKYEPKKVALLPENVCASRHPILGSYWLCMLHNWHKFH